MTWDDGTVDPSRDDRPEPACKAPRWCECYACLRDRESTPKEA